MATPMSPAQATEHADQIIADIHRGGDPEGAHADRDRFAYDVLRIIAEHSADPYVRMFAEQAVRVFKAPGTRWYA